MNKIILHSNIKGGVGKTSTCALFGEYLHEKGYSVKVLDADIQASLSRHRDRELAANPSIIAPWEVCAIDTSDRLWADESIPNARKLSLGRRSLAHT
ncbi:MAG: ParA family protein [Prevotella sp.]